MDEGETGWIRGHTPETKVNLTQHPKINICVKEDVKEVGFYRWVEVCGREFNRTTVYKSHWVMMKRVLWKGR